MSRLTVHLTHAGQAKQSPIFVDLKVGDVFMYAGAYYVKIHCTRYSHNVNAMNLVECQTYFFDNLTLVIPMKGDLTIRPE